MSQESDPGWDTVRVVAPAAVLGGGRGIGRGMRGGAMEALLLDASGVVNFFDVPDRGGGRKTLRVVDVEGARAEARRPVARAIARSLSTVLTVSSWWGRMMIGRTGSMF